MALVRADRVLETTTSTGTGTITLAGAVDGYQAFSDRLFDEARCIYCIEDTENDAWEVGRGVWHDDDTIVRTASEVHSSSNSDALVDFAAGTKNVMLVVSAEQMDDLSNRVFHAHTSQHITIAPVGEDECVLYRSEFKQVPRYSAGHVTDATNPNSGDAVTFQASSLSLGGGYVGSQDRQLAGVASVPPDDVPGYLNEDGTDDIEIRSLRWAWQGTDVPYLAINNAGDGVNFKDWQSLLIYIRLEREDGEGLPIEGFLPLAADLELANSDPVVQESGGAGYIEGDPYSIREAALRRHLGLATIGQQGSITMLNPRIFYRRFEREHRTFLQEVSEWYWLRNDGFNVGRFYENHEDYIGNDAWPASDAEDLTDEEIAPFRISGTIAFVRGDDPRLDHRNFGVFVASEGGDGGGVELSDEEPQPPGTASSGTADKAARDDHVHGRESEATTSASGLMSSDDKTKLDGISTEEVSGLGSQEHLVDNAAVAATTEGQSNTPTQLSLGKALEDNSILTVIRRIDTSNTGSHDTQSYISLLSNALLDLTAQASPTGANDNEALSWEVNSSVGYRHDSIFIWLGEDDGDGNTTIWMSSGRGYSFHVDIYEYPVQGLKGDKGDPGDATSDLSDDDPLPPAATASAGTSSSASRSDHAHAKESEATTSEAGLMSAADKTKLDGVEESANANVLIGYSAWLHSTGDGDAVSHPWDASLAHEVYPDDLDSEDGTWDMAGDVDDAATSLDAFRERTRMSPSALRKFVRGELYASSEGTSAVSGVTWSTAGAARGSVDGHAGEFKYPRYYSADGITTYPDGDNNSALNGLIGGSVFTLGVGKWKAACTVRVHNTTNTTGSLFQIEQWLMQVVSGNDDIRLTSVDTPKTRNFIPVGVESATVTSLDLADVFDRAESGIMNLTTDTSFYFLWVIRRSNTDRWYDSEFWDRDEWEIGGSIEIEKYA